MPVVAVLNFDREAGRFAWGLRCLCHVLYSSRTSVDMHACMPVHAHVCACILGILCVCARAWRACMCDKKSIEVRGKHENQFKASDLSFFFEAVVINKHSLLNTVSYKPERCVVLLLLIITKQKNELMLPYLHFFSFFNGLTQTRPLLIQWPEV